MNNLFVLLKEKQQHNIGFPTLQLLATFFLFMTFYFLFTLYL